MTESDILYIAPSKIHGNGLFTNVNIPSKTRIIEVADLVRRSTGLKWINTAGDSVNHQKNGNTYVEQSGSKFHLVSLRDIVAGEELTTDYQNLHKAFDNRITGYVESH